MIGVANPAGAAALVAVAALIVLHLWDRRRRVVRVSALFLWRRLPAAPLERRRRLRPDLPFWLRIAALLALVGSLLRPWTSDPGVPAATARVIVLDVSASMQTREPDGPRFASARRRAAALAAASGATMLVAAGARPHVALGWTADATEVRRRLETLDALDVAGELAPAVGLAVAEARARPGTRITVLTDLPPEASGVADDDRALVDWVALGRTDDNASVAAVTVEAPPFRPLADAAVTVVVRNHAARARTVTVDARVHDRPWMTGALSVPAREAAEIRFADPPDAGLVTVALDGRDALAADDVVHAWLPRPAPLDLLVVSDRAALPAAMRDLAAAVPGARVATATGAEHAGGATAGVVVLDGDVADGGTASTLVVAPAPGNALCPAPRRATAAAVVDWDPDHALLAGLGGLEALGVAAASVLDAVPWGAAVAHAASSDASFPFLVAGERDGRRVACIAAAPVAPVASTDQLPLVLLTLATLRWLQEGSGDVALVVPTGVAVPAPAGAATAAGLTVAGDPPALMADRVGAFPVGAGRVVLANLLDARESDVGRAAPGEWPARRTAGDAPATSPRREHGPTFTLAALALLAAEWLVWTRRRA